MKQSGYYEVIHHMESLTGLKMRVMSGNVQFNRLHWHDSPEIMCCIHGSFSIRLPDSVFRLQEGDLITFAGGIPHEIFDGTPDGLQLIFSVDPSLLRLSETEQYAFSTVGASALSIDHPDIYAVRRSIARLLCLLPAGNDEQWYRFHTEFYQILTTLSRHKISAPIRTHSTGQFSRFLTCLEIVHRDYQKPISAASLAAEIGFSEPTIYRLFQKHTGVSFTEYLNSVRISSACGILEQTGSGVLPSMTDLAAQCGFISLSNFYRAFHQFTGLSPREYRKLHQVPATPGSTATQNHNDNKRLYLTQNNFQHELLRMNQFQPMHLLPPQYMDDIRQLAEL